MTITLATALIAASHLYGPTSLKTLCFTYLLTEITSDNVCVTLEHAHTYDETSIYDRCLAFIYVNASDVMRSANFGNLCRDCVQMIAKSDDLNTDEFIVLEALLAWADGECTRQQIQLTDKNRREVLGKILFHVRFATMDVSSFTMKISNTDVLNSEEKIILYQFFHGQTYTLPVHFNKTERRQYVVNQDLVRRATDTGGTYDDPANSPTHLSLPMTHYKTNNENETNSQIRRAIRFQGLGKSWQMKAADAIDFRVTMPILLRGVQIFGSYSDSGTESYRVDIWVHDDMKADIRHDEKTIIPTNTTKIYDVMLTTPVRVPAERIFTIQLMIRGPPTHQGVDGSAFVIAEGVGFEFINSNKSLNGTDISMGQIPAILFSKL